MDQFTLHQSKTVSRSGNAYEKFRRFYALDSAAPAQILDVGCGTGDLDLFLRARGHHVIGLDAHAPADIQCDLNGVWPVGDSQFDYVICTDVAEHLYDPAHVLREAARVLKPGGKLVFGVPNHFDLRQRLRMLFGSGIVHWDNLRDINAQERPWQYAHIRFFNLKDLLQMFAENGWHPEFLQFNFQAGGIVPARFTPDFFRSALLRIWPALFSGKFIAGLARIAPGKDPHPPPQPVKIFIAKTPRGL